MGFLDKITETSWANPGLDQAQASREFSERAARRLGLLTFLAVATSLFFLFVMAYRERMELGDWYPLREPGVLWLNTALLVLASVAMQRARNAVSLATLRAPLLLAGVFALGFIAGQYAAWRALDAQAVYGPANPAYAFFLLLTAVHALHLAGGLVVWARTLTRALVGTDREELEPTVHLCALYWHYLLLVWVVLFVLLLTT